MPTPDDITAATVPVSPTAPVPPVAAPGHRRKYYIDLNNIYEIMPNQEWGAGRQRHSVGIRTVHQKLITDFTSRIWKAVRHNSDSAHTQWVDGSDNLNYFISGNRGTGKSTFLHHLRKCITGEVDAFKQSQANKPEGTPPKIAELFTCDPTAMPDKENFFVNVVAAIKEKLTSTAPGFALSPTYQLSGGAHDHGNNGNHYHDVTMLTRAQSCLEKLESLARGIKQLGKQDNQQGDRDPLALLNADIKDRISSIQLKRQFDELINDIAERNHIDAFYIAIDDADIHSTCNLKIIETIRAYLTHPRIIILFTGDKRLINEMVRQNQFKQFDAKYHKSDTGHEQIRWDIIETMTAQYIKKIFPPTNYIQLTSLWEVIQEEMHADYILLPGDGAHRPDKEIPITRYVNNIFRASIVARTEHADILVEGFFRLPIRSIVHTLRYWLDRDIDTLLSEADEGQTPQNRVSLAELLYNSFSRSFFRELFSPGFNRSDLELNNIYQTCRGLLQHCAHSKDIAYCHHLVTNNTRFEQQESTLLLAAKTASTVFNMGDVLTYLIFGPISACAFRHFRVQLAGPSSEVDAFKSFADKLHSDHTEAAIRRSRKISQILLSTNMDESDFSILHGIARVKGGKEIKITEYTQQSIINKLETEETDKESTRKALYTFLGADIMVEQDNREGKSYYVTPYNLLGFALDCYKAISSTHETTKQIKAILNLLETRIRHVIKNIAKEERSGDNSPAPYQEQLNLLAEQIVKWGNDGKQLQGNVNAAELGEIADLFYHTFKNAERIRWAEMPHRLYGENAAALRPIIAREPDAHGREKLFLFSTFVKIADFPFLGHISEIRVEIGKHVRDSVLLCRLEEEFYNQYAQTQNLLTACDNEIAALKESIRIAYADHFRYGEHTDREGASTLAGGNDSIDEACRSINSLYSRYSALLNNLGYEVHKLRGIHSKLKKMQHPFPEKITGMEQHLDELIQAYGQLKISEVAFLDSNKEILIQAILKLVEGAKLVRTSETMNENNTLSHIFKQSEQLKSTLENRIKMSAFHEQLNPLQNLYSRFMSIGYRHEDSERRYQIFTEQLILHQSLKELREKLKLSKEELQSRLRTPEPDKGDDDPVTKHLATWNDLYSNVSSHFMACSYAIGNAITKQTSATVKELKERCASLAGLSRKAFKKEQSDILNDIDIYAGALDEKELLFSASFPRFSDNRMRDIPLFFHNFASAFGLQTAFAKARKNIMKQRNAVLKATPQKTVRKSSAPSSKTTPAKPTALSTSSSPSDNKDK